MQTYSPLQNEENENRWERKRTDLARMWRLRCNWAYIMIVTALVCVGYASPFSSLHQFITYPRENGSGVEQPGTSGLGESEFVYAWVIAMYSVGETIAAVGTGALLLYFSYWSCFLFSVFLHLVGGVFYGAATNGAMMLVSRLLIGAHAGLGWSLAVAYFGESCDEYDQLKLSLEEEREDGWITSGEDGGNVEGEHGRNVAGEDGGNVAGEDGGNVAGEHGRNDAEVEPDGATDGRRSKAEQGEEHTPGDMKRQTHGGKGMVIHRTRTKDLLHSLFAISNCLMSGMGVVLVLLLQFIPAVDKFRVVGWLNSILAAGVILLQLVMFRGEGYCRWGWDNWEMCRIRDRPQVCHQPCKWANCHWPSHKAVFLFLLVLVFYTIDSGYNIIDTLANPVLTNQFAFTVEDSTYFFSVATFGFAIGALTLPLLHRLKVDNRRTWVFSTVLAFTGTVILADWQSIGSDPCNDHIFNSSSSCENMTFPGDTCYWLQRSRVTGKMCMECPSGCASSERTLNFVQFCFAFLLWVTAVPLVRAVTYIITSDQVGKNKQGTVLGICTAAGGLSRVITPLWLNSLYVSAGQHTWIPMIPLLVNLAAIILGFLLLCRRMNCCCLQSPDPCDQQSTAQTIRDREVHYAEHTVTFVETRPPSVSWSVVNNGHVNLGV